MEIYFSAALAVCMFAENRINCDIIQEIRKERSKTMNCHRLIAACLVAAFMVLAVAESASAQAPYLSIPRLPIGNDNRNGPNRKGMKQ